ncbi:MAG: YraN family protein [Spirochaetia bacterium]|nr:YraN family protein [Spirochaetia bacterium]
MKGRLDRRFRHAGEEKALEFFENSGHKLLRHNYHTGGCEVDLITQDSTGTVHFIEVKAWKQSDIKHPLEALDAKKRAGMRRAARLYLLEAGLNDDRQISMDLLWIQPDGGVEFFEAIF